MELLVPPLAMGNIPLTKVEEARFTGPDDNPPKELECTIPVPKVENTPADVTVRLPPTPVFPETVKPVAYPVPKDDVPDTLRLEVLTTAFDPVTLSEVPTPKLPDINPAPDIPSVAPEMDLVTDNESKMEAEVTFNDCPTPTLPTRLDTPVTLRVVKAAAEVTDKDWPTPTLPLLVKDPAYAVPNDEVPVTLRADVSIKEVTLSDVPTPTLPVVDSVASPVWAVTVKPESPLIKEVILAVPPIPTLPVVVKVEPYAVPNTDVPETLRLVPAMVALAAVAVNDPPTPTLPDTDKDEPIPKNPV